MRLELNLDFEERFAPDRFFFGVAYAPYCEGGLNGPDGSEEHGLGAIRKPGDKRRRGIRFWTNYPKHVELAASLGLNAFRMGIEWARCQPSASTERTDPPQWDDAALDHYADMVEAVIDHGMQPIVTLHHFTHPLWLGVDIWLEERVPTAGRRGDPDRGRGQQRLMARGGKKMAHFLVYNEPNLVPLFYHSLGWYPVERRGPEYLLPAFDTMLSHYVRAYDGLHDLFEARWGSRASATRSRASAPTNTTSSSTTCSGSELGRGAGGRRPRIAECRGHVADGSTIGEVTADRRGVRAVRGDGEARSTGLLPSEGSPRRWTPCTRRRASGSSTTCR